jgi:hypothetical protein
MCDVHTSASSIPTNSLDSTRRRNWRGRRRRRRRRRRSGSVGGESERGVTHVNAATASTGQGP